MPTTRMFKSGNSLAVRIPADMAYADRGQELTITRLGDVITIVPSRPGLKEAIALLRAMPKPATVELLDRIDMADREPA